MTNRILLTVAMTAAAGGFAFSKPAAAQRLPPIKKAPHVQILQGPEIERGDSYLTIIRWTSNNPRGTDRHWGVVHYGTDPKNLDQVDRLPGTNATVKRGDDLLLHGRRGRVDRRKRQATIPGQKLYGHSLHSATGLARPLVRRYLAVIL
jgi:hypothetical protein